LLLAGLGNVDSAGELVAAELLYVGVCPPCLIVRV
jgi:hypothetical protein